MSDLSRVSIDIFSGVKQSALRRCFVSIGSNIRPKTNVPHILEALLEGCYTLHISRIMETASVDMLDNSQSFFNLTAAFDTELNSAELKTWFQSIETRLGRDRTNPLSKKLGRPADIDEIFSLPLNALTVAEDQLPPEPHIRPMLVELLAYLNVAHYSTNGLTQGVALRLDGREIGRKSMTLIKTYEFTK